MTHRLRSLPALLVGLLPLLAFADDRTAGLYATQIRFDGQKTPIVTVGLMDGQASIAFSSRGRIRFLPDGPGGPEIVVSGGRRFVAKVEKSTPARLRWRVSLGAFPANDLERIQAARKRLTDAGLKVQSTELGGVFGFFGRVIDTRRLVLVSEALHVTRADAEVAAKGVTVAGVTAEPLPVLDEPAHGELLVTDGQVQLKARDVLWFEAEDPKQDLITVHEVESGRGYAWHARQDRKYRGTLYLTVDAQGKLAVADLVSGEELLEGLVPAEIYPTAPPAALEVQAISARGELLAKLGHRHLADPWMLCADVHCQVYAGASKEDPRTSAAVQKTRGNMLVTEDGRVVDTVYSASCGGHTEHNENVWSTPPAATLRGVPDGPDVLGDPTEARVRAWVTTVPNVHCGTTRFAKQSFRWSKVVAVADLERTLKPHGVAIGLPTSVTVTKRGVSGRASALALEGTTGKATLTGELTIRKALGGLKSSLFVVDAQKGPNGQPTAFKFTGGGFGHGVGMCQTGAIGMAEQGKPADQILKHYFQGSRVERIY